MELTLQGTDGKETVSVDNLGKVLKIDEDTKVEPVAGDDVQLTIDTDWQSAIYQILKQRVAGVLTLTDIIQNSASVMTLLPSFIKTTDGVSSPLFH